LAIAGITAAAAVAALTVFAATRPDPPIATPVVLPSATSQARVLPAAVQAYADGVSVSFDGIERMDRKVVVQLGDVPRPAGSPAISGATDATWAIVVVGDIRQTWGLLPVPNGECAIWFVNSIGEVVATQRGALSACDPYLVVR
jgi:hypothetical protein